MEHFLKFLAVGTWGFIVNTVILITGVKIGLSPSISGPLGAEIAIISNFLLNNFWTFSDKQITNIGEYPIKFIQFNLLSMGSVIIQFLFLKAGEKIFGLKSFKEPFIDFPVVKNNYLVNFVTNIPFLLPVARKFSAYFIFYMAGVGVGLIVNFIVYSQIIWR